MTVNINLLCAYRPQLMLGYAYPLDSAGHTTGPNSQKVEIIYCCIKVIDL